MCAVLFICDFLSTLQWTHVHEVTIKLMLLITDTIRLQCILLIEINLIFGFLWPWVSIHETLTWKIHILWEFFKKLLKSFQWQNWKHLPNYLYVALSYAFNRKIPSPIPDTRVFVFYENIPIFFLYFVLFQPSTAFYILCRMATVTDGTNVAFKCVVNWFFIDAPKCLSIGRTVYKY